MTEHCYISAPLFELPNKQRSIGPMSVRYSFLCRSNIGLQYRLNIRSATRLHIGPSSVFYIGRRLDRQRNLGKTIYSHYWTEINLGKNTSDQNILFEALIYYSSDLNSVRNIVVWHDDPPGERGDQANNTRIG